MPIIPESREGVAGLVLNTSPSSADGNVCDDHQSWVPEPITGHKLTPCNSTLFVGNCNSFTTSRDFRTNYSDLKTGMLLHNFCMFLLRSMSQSKERHINW